MSIDFEERATETWTHFGVECAIAPSPFGNLNGYVRIPAFLRPLYGSDWEALAIFRVHGGVTYGKDENGWIGFDTAHSGDVWPKEVTRKHRPEGSDYDPGDTARRTNPDWRTDWTRTELKRETERLAEQVQHPQYILRGTGVKLSNWLSRLAVGWR